MSLALWYHTVRPLRGRQILAQLRNRLARYTEDPEAFRARPVPAYPGARLRPRAPFLPPAARAQPRGDLLAGVFAFLNRREQIGFPPRWSAPGLPRLWQYNLHYFEYLWDLGIDAARVAALDWIERHPLGARADGLGAVSDVAAARELVRVLLRRAPGAQRGRRRAPRRALELDLPAGRMARAPSGNAPAGQPPARERRGAAAGRALLRGRGRRGAGSAPGAALLEAELPEQVLADGGHVERSPMYQLRVAWLLLALRNAGGDALAAADRRPAGPPAARGGGAAPSRRRDRAASTTAPSASTRRRRR